MAARRKLIVVSNRGPVSFTRDEDGNRVARRGGGGLVTALRSLVAHHDVTWIASAMTDEDRTVAEEAGGEAIEEVARDGSPYRLRLVSHDPAAYDWYYNVVANPTLWFLQHYLWALAYAPDIDRGLHHAWDDGYVPVNRAFADAVLIELDAQPDASVFFHDYHLYLAPRFVRDARPDASLGHFVHIPWPEPNLWRVLPEQIRRAIHDGLLANDVVGFHANRWRRSFLRSSRDLLDAECDFDSSICSWRRRADLCGRAADLGRPVRVRGARGERAGASPRGGARVAPSRVPRSSASTGPTRRRTSSAASGRSSSTSMPIPRCTAASGCSRSSTRRARTFRSTPSTWARSSARRGWSTTASSGTAGCRSTCGSRTTSRSRLPRTSSTTCCS